MSTWTDCYDCRISWDDDYGKEYECPLCKAHNRIAELEAEVATLQRKNTTLLESCKVRGAAMECAEAEVERLKAERDHWASQTGPDSCVAILKENERLEAEVERLRVALEALAPACRAWLDDLPEGTRSRGDEAGAWMWKKTSSHREEPGIGIMECRLVIEALATSAPTKPGPDSP